MQDRFNEARSLVKLVRRVAEDVASGGTDILIVSVGQRHPVDYVRRVLNQPLELCLAPLELCLGFTVAEGAADDHAGGADDGQRLLRPGSYVVEPIETQTASQVTLNDDRGCRHRTDPALRQGTVCPLVRLCGCARHHLATA